MIDYSQYTVFIFGAGGRQVLPVCKGFCEIGCRVINYCYSSLDTGALTKYKAEKIVYNKSKADDTGFFGYGLRLIKENKYSLVVPMSDQGAIFLSKHKDDIPRSTRVAVNDWDVFQYAIDKAQTMKVCMDNNIPAPRTIFGDNLEDQVNTVDFEYPVVVKPRTGVGSIGFNIIHTKENLVQYLRDYDHKNGSLLIQEYIKQGKQPQYRADLFRTYKGEFKAACVGKVTRWYPLDGGSGIHIVSIHDEEIVENCKQLLDAIGWIGYANIDMVFDEKNGIAKIIEINGRTGASIKIDYVCGVNVSQLILENEMGLPVTDMTGYEEGKQTACFLPDLLWLLKSKDRFKSEPSWFDRKGIKDVIFSWDDPLPTFGFLLESIENFFPAMAKRRRTRA